MQYKIILLAGEWDSTPVVYNFLKEYFTVTKVIIEKPVSKKEFLKRRIKRLGIITVGGQILFQIFVSKILKRLSRARIAQILKQNSLSAENIPEDVIIKIPSVNSDECLKEINSIKPDLIVVHGTRIISKNLLRNANCKFINIHAGITPLYRGVHGAYWALANNDKDNCGVTVHFIDEGIDTGSILMQGPIQISKKDNFTTYPFLQLAEGLKLLKNSIELLPQFNNMPSINKLKSGLWHHPTLWNYLYIRITKGVK